MITFDQVSVRFGTHIVLDRASLHVAEGSMALVTGATGAGKSTLLRCVNGLVPHFTGGQLSGTVTVAGRDTRQHRPRDLSDVVGMVGQNPAAGFVTSIVEDEIAYGMESLGVAPAAMRRRVEETLDLLGIADLRDRDLRTLSGGQQQRVAIAAVLAPGPRVLVLDEPTSALDPVAAEEVLASITRVVHDLGLTVLLCEHRLERVVAFADDLITVRDGKLTMSPVLLGMAHAELAPPVVHLGRLLGLDPVPLTIRDARRATARLRSRLAPPEAELPARAPSTTALVRVRNLVVHRGNHRALRTVDLTAYPGQILAVMGRNGSGKSTLLGAIAGLLAPRAGTIRVDGLIPQQTRASLLTRHVGLVPHDPNLVLYADSVRAETDAADREAGLPQGTSRQRWSALLGITSHPDPDTHPRDLSEGQRLALALVVLLAREPTVIALDEPTRGLDYHGKDRLARWLRDLTAEDRCVLVATHDVEFAAQCADRVLLLAQGEVVLDTNVTAALTSSPAFAPQVAKVLHPHPVLTVAQVARLLEASRRTAVEADSPAPLDPRRSG